MQQPRNVEVAELKTHFSPAALVFMRVVVHHIFSCLAIQVYRVATVRSLFSRWYLCVFVTLRLGLFRRAKVSLKVSKSMRKNAKLRFGPELFSLQGGGT